MGYLDLPFICQLIAPSRLLPQPLPVVPRLWCPSVQCPECKHPNDAYFSFCQRCGYQRSANTLTPAYTKLKIDLSSVDNRLASIRAQRKSLPYERQKSALEKELETFLRSLPSPKTLQSATPHDLTRFLVWKDGKGKTKVHIPQCPLFGSHSKTPCKCPTRLAAGTVDNIIGKLRAIFTSTGRNGPWNDLFGSGNPACDNSVKEYLHFITKEQTAAHVRPKQALPLFFDKLSTLIRHLISEAFSPSKVPPVQRYIFARDASFFCVDFFSGDRGSDLGRTLTKEVLLLPDGQGFLFRQTAGKTLRGKDYKTFAIKKCQDDHLCPVANLSRYFHLCKSMAVDLRDGYLFRSTDKHGRVSTNPFVGSTVAARLHTHLTALGIAEGETMHSLRRGCSITLSLMGASLEQISTHIGWKSTQTAKYYTQTDKVLGLTKVADMLSQSTSAFGKDTAPKATIIAETFRSHDNLTGCRLAFP